MYLVLSAIDFSGNQLSFLGGGCDYTDETKGPVTGVLKPESSFLLFDSLPHGAQRKNME